MIGMIGAQLFIALGTVTMIACAAALGMILGSARCPGAPAVGGALAGLLLGPAVLGAAWPDLHRQLFLGAPITHEQLDEVQRRHETDLVAARHARLDAATIDEIRRRHAAEIVPLQSQLRDAQHRDQTPHRLLILLVIIFAMIAAGAAPRPRGAAPQIASAMSIGAWSAAVSGAIVFAVASRLGYTPRSSALAAIAVGVGPILLSPSDRRIAEEAEIDGAALLFTAGRIATLLAIAIGGGLWAWHGRSAGPSVYAVPATAIVGVIGIWAIGGGLRRFCRPATALLEIVLIPTIAAAACTRLHPYQHAAFWPIVVALLASGDGRWIGAALGGLITGGRRLMPTFRLAVAAMPCGTAQLLVVVAAITWGELDEQLALALVAGALLVELTGPMRAGVARRMREMEHEP